MTYTAIVEVRRKLNTIGNYDTSNNNNIPAINQYLTKTTS